MNQPNKILSEAGRIRASLRVVHDMECRRCGKAFKGLVTAYYCSNACKIAAYRARKKQREQDSQ